MMHDHVREQVVRVIGLDPGVVRSDQGFTDLGMDSLMAVELSNRLKATLRQPLPSTLAFERRRSRTCRPIC
jgi:acyl carrier protein